MKKLVALFLALVMTLSLCTVAFAEETKTFDDIVSEHPELPSTPEDAWYKNNGDGTRVYFYKDSSYPRISGIYFYFPKTGQWNSPSIIDGTTIFTNVDGNYVYATQTDKFIFNVSDNTIVKFVLEPINDGTDVTGTYEPTKSSPINCEELAKGAAIVAGITVVTVGTIHTVKAIKNYKAEKAAAAEAAKLAEMPMVAFGSSGDAVTTLQTELNAQGYNCGEVDGVFGQNTLNAVIAFQTAKGLTADGVVGAQTWEALL